MDDYVRELMEDRAAAIWVARLRSGATVYMDDGRPSLSPPSAWLRLKGRVRAEGDPVVNLGLKFRSHEEWPLPENAPAYFFSHGVMGDPDGPNVGFMIVGAASWGGVVSTKKYSVPALILFEEGHRPCESGDCLIVNPEGPLAHL